MEENGPRDGADSFRGRWSGRAGVNYDGESVRPSARRVAMPPNRREKRCTRDFASPTVWFTVRTEKWRGGAF